MGDFYMILFIFTVSNINDISKVSEKATAVTQNETEGKLKKKGAEGRKANRQVLFSQVQTLFDSKSSKIFVK